MLALLSLGVASCISTSGPAETTPQETPKPQEKPAPTAVPDGSPAWTPPEPGSDKWDWIKLTSGEWLKGEIEYLRRDELEFESDELGRLTLDWDDIAELRSPRALAIVLEGRATATGTVLIRDGVVLVGDENPQQFDRDDVTSIVASGAKEIEHWTGKITAGLSFRSGNTDQTDFTTTASFRRRAAFTRFSLDYIGNVGELDDARTIENHRVDTSIAAYLSQRFYLIPFLLNVFRDPFQNIAVRVTPGAGFGYKAIDSKRVEWAVEPGFGYRYTKFDEVESGGDSEDTTAAALLRTTMEIEITKDIDLDLLYSVQVGVPETADTDQHAEVELSVDITNSLEIDIQWIWDRIGQPEREDDGTRPKKDDFRLVVGLGIEF